MALEFKPAQLKGLKEVVDNLNKEIKKIENGSLEGLLEAALLVRSESMKLCPVVTGNLRASAFVTWGYIAQTPRSFTQGDFRDPIGRKGVKEARMAERTQGLGASASRVAASVNPMVEIGHTAIYAVSIHENPRAGKTGGFAPSAPSSSKPKSLKGGKGIYPPGTYSKVGQWKFLETALKENEGRILEIIRRNIKIP